MACSIRVEVYYRTWHIQFLPAAGFVAQGKRSVSNKVDHNDQ